MNDTLTTRIAGVLMLLSITAECAALGIAFSHGGGPASMNAMNWGIGEQLLTFQPSWMRVLFPFAVLAPCLAMLAWPGMYHVLAPGGASAFYGVIVMTLAMFLGVIAEALRLSMVVTLPTAYLAGSDAVKPAVLTVGATLGHLFQILQETSVIVLFAVGTPLIALAIIRGRTLPPWLGWVLIIPSVLVGYIGGPLLLLDPSIGGPFVGLGLNIFFAWFVIVGILLLRWQPYRYGGQAVSTAT